MHHGFTHIITDRTQAGEKKGAHYDTQYIKCITTERGQNRTGVDVKSERDEEQEERCCKMEENSLYTHLEHTSHTEGGDSEG